MKIHECAELLAEIKRRYPTFQIGDETASVWLRELQYIEAHQATAALDEYFRENKFAPSFSCLRKLIVKHGGYRSKEYQAQTEAQRKAWRKKKIDCGLLPCHREGKFLGWFPAEYATSIGTNLWSLKIDVVLGRWGGTKTTAELKRRLAVDDLYKAISKGREFSREYKAVLDDMLAQSETDEVEDIFG